MHPLDIPEMLIALGLVAILAWGLYNWKRRAHTPRWRLHGAAVHSTGLIPSDL